MDDQHQDVIERMGRLYESEGMTRIAGRLLGFLMLARNAHSLDGLAEALEVSKTSVSTNARLLEQFGLLERVTHPGDRKDYYRVKPDQSHLLELRLRRIREMAGIFEQAEEVAHDGGDRHVLERIRTMRRFNGEALAVLQGLLDSWTGGG